MHIKFDYICNNSLCCLLQRSRCVVFSWSISLGDAHFLHMDCRAVYNVSTWSAVLWAEGPCACFTEKAQFELEFERMINHHKSFPSIVMYVVFNEGWGQYEVLEHCCTNTRMTYMRICLLISMLCSTQAALHHARHNRACAHVHHMRHAGPKHCDANAAVHHKEVMLHCSPPSVFLRPCYCAFRSMQCCSASDASEVPLRYV